MISYFTSEKTLDTKDNKTRIATLWSLWKKKLKLSGDMCPHIA